MEEMKSRDHASLLPSNASRLELALEEAMAPTDASRRAVAKLRALWDPYACPTSLLPFLAWALSVDDWDPRWDDETKREVIAVSAGVHRRKGTLAAVKEALRSLRGKRVPLDRWIELTEWWETDPPDDPGTFLITVLAHSELIAAADLALDEAFLETLDRAVEAAKPLRCHYRKRYDSRLSAGVGLGGTVSGALVLRSTLELTE